MIEFSPKTRAHTSCYNWETEHRRKHAFTVHYHGVLFETSDSWQSGLTA